MHIFHLGNPIVIGACHRGWCGKVWPLKPISDFLPVLISSDPIYGGGMEFFNLNTNHLSWSCCSDCRLYISAGFSKETIPWQKFLLLNFILQMPRQNFSAANLKTEICEVMTTNVSSRSLLWEVLGTNIYQTFCFKNMSLVESFFQEFRHQIPKVSISGFPTHTHSTPPFPEQRRAAKHWVTLIRLFRLELPLTSFRHCSHSVTVCPQCLQLAIL